MNKSYNQKNVKKKSKTTNVISSLELSQASPSLLPTPLCLAFNPTLKTEEVWRQNAKDTKVHKNRSWMKRKSRKKYRSRKEKVVRTEPAFLNSSIHEEWLGEQELELVTTQRSTPAWQE